MKLCECGCGLPAPIANRTRTEKGYVKGQPHRFRSGHYRPARTTTGYHRKSVVGRASGQVQEHVLIAERALGKRLPRGAEVHHVDENPRNNSNGNLVVCQDKAFHKLLHVRARIVRAGGNPNVAKICSTCKRLRPFGEFNKASKRAGLGLQSRCRECQASYTRAYVRPSKRSATT